MLLAWLVHHGSRPGTPAERAVHAVVRARAAVCTVSSGPSLTNWPSQREHPENWSMSWSTTSVARSSSCPTSNSAPCSFLQSLARLTHVRLIVEARTGSAAHRALAGEGCAELDLNLERWRDQRRHKEWLAAHPLSASRRQSPRT
ncbi:hypothetical protein NKH18_43785 [Streptomyces sp. M10(2022)]